jgi:hypothetical protein
MARGFESKDVEYQQIEAQRTPGDRSPGQRESHALSDRRTLELSLARAEADLAVARSAAHRQMLAQAIAALRAQLDRGAATTPALRPSGTLDALKS